MLKIPSCHDFMPLSHIRAFYSDMQKLSTPESLEFLGSYILVDGDMEYLGNHTTKYQVYEPWIKTRDKAIFRMKARMQLRGLPCFRLGLPTITTLQLYSWAYDPSPAETRKARLIMTSRQKEET